MRSSGEREFEIQDMGGTFVPEERPSLTTRTGRTRRPIGSGRHRTSQTYASWMGCEEAREDDERVRTGRNRFHLQPCWFAPRPTKRIHRPVGRGKKFRIETGKGFLRGVDCHALPATVELAEIEEGHQEDEFDREEPGFQQLKAAITELLTCNPYFYGAILDRAVNEASINVLYALTEAVRRLTVNDRAAIARDIRRQPDIVTGPIDLYYGPFTWSLAPLKQAAK
jgi:hypothetical protein